MTFSLETICAPNQDTLSSICPSFTLVHNYTTGIIDGDNTMFYLVDSVR